MIDIKDVLNLETAERYYIRGVLGNPYEFNVLPLTNDFSGVTERFNGYEGVFVFTRRTVDVSTGSVSHKYLGCGCTDDIASVLRGENNITARAIDIGANCLCYYYEPSAEVREITVYDISDKNGNQRAVK